MLVSLLNDANEFFRSRLCAPTLSRLTQTRLQIQSPDLKLKIALFRLFPIVLVSFLNDVNEFITTLHIFLQKRLATGIASLSLMIPFFSKNSRLGYFFHAKNLLNDANEFITTLHLFLRKRLATGIASLSLMIPFFSKNSRLGYFFHAKNLLNDANEFFRSRLCPPTLSRLTQTRLQINLPWSSYRKRPPPD